MYYVDCVGVFPVVGGVCVFVELVHVFVVAAGGVAFAGGVV